MVVILRQHENWCRLSSQAKSTSEVHTSAGHIGQGRQSIGSPSNPPNKLWLRESVKGRFRDWVNRFRGLANLSEDALTRCPVFGSRGNRQPRQILFRIQILSKSRGVRDQSMTTQQHQLVQNQVSKAQLSIHGSGWFYSGHSGFHPFF